MACQEILHYTWRLGRLELKLGLFDQAFRRNERVPTHTGHFLARIYGLYQGTARMNSTVGDIREHSETIVFNFFIVRIDRNRTLNIYSAHRLFKRTEEILEHLNAGHKDLSAEKANPIVSKKKGRDSYEAHP